MRVSADVKRQTRQRLLRVAHELLVRKGPQDMTTRDVAVEAGLAPSTFFNYFPSKKALALCLCHQLLAEGDAEFAARPHGDETLEEALLGHIAAGLRRLAPFRGWAGDLLGATIRRTAVRPQSPERPPRSGNAARNGDAHEAPPDDDPFALRSHRLRIVARLIARHRGSDAATPVTLHIYWSLYLGVLAWWSTDTSPQQERTRAMLHDSLHMFVTALASPRAL